MGKANDNQQSSEEAKNWYDEQGYKLMYTWEMLKTAKQDRKGPTSSICMQIQKCQEDNMITES